MPRIVLQRTVIGLVLTLALLVGGVWVAHAAAAGPTPRPTVAGSPRPAFPAQLGPLAAPGKLVVAVALGYDKGALAAFVGRQGGTIERWLPHLGLALVDVAPGAEAATASALETSPDIAFVAAHNKSVRLADVPLDQYFPQQWGMAKVGGPQAWDIAWGDPGTVIAIVDTGVNNYHEDLRQQTWINPGESIIDPLTGLRVCDNNGIDDDENGYVDDCRGWNFAQNNNNTGDGHGHGTAVTGVAAATTNNFDPVLDVYAGVAGMARGARYMPLRALDSDGEGYPLDIASAIDYAADMGARVINLSLVLATASPDEGDINIFRLAVEYAQAHEVSVVGASGNTGYGMVFYPAALPGVLAVGASTEADTKASFSNYGPRLDLVAPGVGIFSTLRQPGFSAYGLFGGAGDGTSFAVPHVVGVIALVRSLRPDLGQAAVSALITTTVDDVADPGFDPETGWGRLDAYRAVWAATTGLTLSLSADPPTVPGGSHTTVAVQVRALGGVAAGLGGRVAVSSSLGMIGPAVLTVDGTGRATTVFTAPVGATEALITATLGAVSATLPVRLTSGQPATMTVAAVPDRIASGGGQAVVTATLRDEGGSLVADGVTVTFTTTLGSTAPQQVTTVGGQAATLLTSGAMTGTAHVLVSAQGVTAATDVQILGAGQPFAILLAAQPASMTAGGGPSTITATVLDGLGTPVPDGTPVHFAATQGVLSHADRTTAGGQASTQLTPGTAAGVAAVVASSTAVSSTLQVPILAAVPATVTVQADPAALTAGYNQLAALRAQAADRFGNPVADGTPFVFTSSLGLVTPPVVPSAGGSAQATLVAELIAGASRITVTAGGTATGTTTVLIRPGQPASLTLAAAAAAPAGGPALPLTATVRDAYGNLAETGTPVILSTDLGGLRLPGAATTALSLTIPAQDGLARAELVPGTWAGIAHVRAATAPDLLAAADVAIQPGPPAAPITLTVQPPRVVAGGRALLTLAIRDSYGNPVADGTMAHFAASRGRLEPVDAATQGGLATATLVADEQLGTISIVAVSGGLSAFGSLDVVPAQIYLPLVVRQ